MESSPQPNEKTGKEPDGAGMNLDDPGDSDGVKKRMGLARFPLFSRKKKKKKGEGKEGAGGESEGTVFEEGPDYDFSMLNEESAEKRPIISSLGAKGEDKAAPGIEPAVEETSTSPEEAPAERDVDALLRDVLPSLVDDSVVGKMEKSAGGAVGIAPTLKDMEEAERARLEGLEKEALKEEKRKRREERWGFLAQPRSQDSTFIAFTKPKATLFIFFMLMLGTLLWALPNAFLIPKDTEYVVHAVAIGIVIGLLFWWKAGKKHSTKLAVQSALTTLFSLIIGELLHWIFVVLGTSAFRKVFFDLISFQFLWNRSVLSAVGSAMYPLSYLWILIPASLVAFIIGFGMPPIPEIFLQLWDALRGGKEPEKGEP